MYRNRQIVLHLVFLLAFQLTAQSYRIQESLSFKSKILDREIRYSIVLPKNYYQSGKSYPVMYMLHGLGDNESSWLEYGQVASILDCMTDKKEIKPFICVMPQGFKSYYTDSYDGTFNYQQMFIDELVPYIDSVYRTIPDASQRAVTGYSMGGFGAFVLPVKYPDVFSISIPLSASLRTDEQYINEHPDGWNEQWGKIFGGVGESGDARITDYYKANSPFYLIESKSVDELKKVAFYIENGDKENTLCRSNEFLHIAMLKKGIPHLYNVKEGGHEFSFWRNALPEVFRFTDACFRKVEYLVDAKEIKTKHALPENMTVQEEHEGEISYRVIYPENLKESSRLYPVVYFVADLTKEEQAGLMNLYQGNMQNAGFPPVIFCFVPSKNAGKLSDYIIPRMEKTGRARPGWHFRSLWVYHCAGDAVVKQAFDSLQFTVGVLTTANIRLKESEIAALMTGKPNIRDRMWSYIDTPPTGESYPGNGYMHVYLRENGYKHEYRVRTHKNTFEFLKSGFMPTMKYISKKFHN